MTAISEEYIFPYVRRRTLTIFRVDDCIMIIYLSCFTRPLLYYGEFISKGVCQKIQRVLEDNGSGPMYFYKGWRKGKIYATSQDIFMDKIYHEIKILEP